MLVLSRQRDEEIMLGSPGTAIVELTQSDLIQLSGLLRTHGGGSNPDLASRLGAAKPGPIAVAVVDIRGDKVRIGVQADKSIAIHRREIFNAIKRGDPVPFANTTNGQ